MTKLHYNTVLAAVAKDLREQHSSTLRSSSGAAKIGKEIKAKTSHKKGDVHQVIRLYYLSLTGIDFNRKDKEPKKKSSYVRPSDKCSITLPTHFTTEWCGPSYGNPDACPFD